MWTLRDLLAFVSYNATLRVLEIGRDRKGHYTSVFANDDIITRDVIEKVYPELLDRELADGIHGEGRRDGIYIHLYKEGNER